MTFVMLRTLYLIYFLGVSALVVFIIKNILFKGKYLKPLAIKRLLLDLAITAIWPLALIDQTGFTALYNIFLGGNK